MPYINEDRQELSRLFEQAINQLAAELPDGWTNLCLAFYVDTSERESMFIYISSDEGKHWHDFMDDVFAADDVLIGVFDCKETCQELRRLCAKVGDKWTGFKIIVDKFGGFSADFKYEPFDEMSMMFKRMWLGEYMD